MNALQGKVLLVTGATGFIGRCLVSRLQAIPGVRLVLLSRHPQEHSRPNTVWIRGSLESLSPETWRAAGVECIHTVFHLGGFTPKSARYADDVDAVYRDNLLGTRALLESLPETPERTLFSSTLDVYGRVTQTVLDDTSPLRPVTLYASSKLFCEQLVHTYARDRGCSYTILRYGHIFGPGEEAYRKLIPETIRRLVRGHAPVVHGDGSATRDYLYVTDAVEATLRAATSSVHHLGPVNIVRGSSRPIREIVEILKQITGCSLPTRFTADGSPDRSLSFDNCRMRMLLGDWPLVSLEDGLREEVTYFKGLLR